MSEDIYIHGALAWSVTIVEREEGEAIAARFSELGIHFNLLVLGRGTANSKILDYFGLADSEKDILFSLIPRRLSKPILGRLSDLLKLDKPGHGIAFSLPVTHVCGPTAGKYVKLVIHSDGDAGEESEEGVKAMEQSHSMIMVVINRGFSEEVMGAARKAGATGGTVIHARGTGMKAAEKFFGITVQAEKEIVMIVVNNENRRAVSEAIANDEALIRDEAKPFVFSLPACDVAGLSAAFKP